MQYKIVRKFYSEYDDKRTLKEFEETVNSYCKQGWKPIGGITIEDRDNNFNYLLQAMIKEDEEDNLKEKDMGFFESLMNADEII